MAGHCYFLKAPVWLCAVQVNYCGIQRRHCCPMLRSAIWAKPCSRFPSLNSTTGKVLAVCIPPCIWEATPSQLFLRGGQWTAFSGHNTCLVTKCPQKKEPPHREARNVFQSNCSQTSIATHRMDDSHEHGTALVGNPPEAQCPAVILLKKVFFFFNVS